MEFWDKLLSVLAVADDTPYFPADAYEERFWSFASRGTLLLLLGLVAHVWGLRFHWIWTDHPLIADNPLLRSDRGMLQYWLHPLGTAAAPLGGTLFYLQYQIFAASSTTSYHLFALLAHLGNCLLVWLILRRLEVPGAWLAAAIFAVHPIEVQSISWASRQMDVFATLAGLWSLQCYLSHMEIHPPAPADFAVKPPVHGRLKAFMIVLFVIGALLEPSIVMLAGIFPLIVWWKRGRLDRQEWIELLPILAIGGLVMLAGLVSSEVHQAGGPAAALNPLDRLIMSGRAIWFYVQVLVWPHPLLFVYWRWETSGDWWMIGFLAALAAVAAGLWWKRGQIGCGPLVAVMAFLLLILPHLPLVRSDWMEYSFVADHFFYLAGVPLIALLAAGIVWLFDMIPAIALRRGARLAGGALIVAGLGTLAVMQTRLYGDEIDLWHDTLESDPMSLTARGVLAAHDIEHSNSQAPNLFPNAFLDRLEVLKSHGGPDAASTIFVELERGQILEGEQKYSDAIQIYQQILAIDPKNRSAALRLAVAYKDRGDISKALHAFAEALRRNPNDEELLNEYGLALVQDGQIGDGIEKYQAAIKINPRFVAARLNLSNALFAQGNYAEAAEQLHAASAIDPRSFEAFMNAGVMLATLKNYQSASRMFEAAVQLRPDSALARDDLGVTLAQQGFIDEAIDSFTQAVKLKPDFKEAREHLERAKKERDAKLH